MKKLLIVNTFCNIWSTGRVAAEIGACAKSKGWDCCFAYALDARFCNYQSYRIVSFRVFWFFHFILSRFFNLKGFGSVIDTLVFIRKIKRMNPDVIHLHNIHADYLNVPLFFNFLKKSRIPVVWTMHDCWPVTGGCTYFSYFSCNNWKAGCRCCPRFGNHDKGGELRGILKNMGLMFKLKYKLISRLPNLTMVPISQWTDSVLAASVLHKIRRVIIPNGIDISIFYPRENTDEIRKKYNLGNSFLIIGVASDWSEQKGLNDYVKLAELLQFDVKVLLVGIEKTLLSGNCPRNLVMIPKTSNIDELASLYSTADVVVSMSYQETFGLTVVEGMACGTPAVVYDNTALPELIHPETGYVVHTGCVEDVKEKVLLIKEKGKIIYKEHCVKTVSKYYLKETQYQKYVDLYNEVIAL